MGYTSKDLPKQQHGQTRLPLLNPWFNLVRHDLRSRSLASRCPRRLTSALDRHRSVAWVASIGVTIAGYGFLFGYSDNLLPLTYNVLVLIWFCLGAAIDLVLTATLIVCLRRSVLGFNPNTDGAIKRIMRVALQTASYTSLLSVTGAVMAALPPQPRTINAVFAFQGESSRRRSLARSCES